MYRKTYSPCPRKFNEVNTYVVFLAGAVYCDRTLRMGGFDGEGVQSGAVLVVKSHSSTPMWNKVKGHPMLNSKVSFV